MLLYFLGSKIYYFIFYFFSTFSICFCYWSFLLLRADLTFFSSAIYCSVSGFRGFPSWRLFSRSGFPIFFTCLSFSIDSTQVRQNYLILFSSTSWYCLFYLFVVSVFFVPSLLFDSYSSYYTFSIFAHISLSSPIATVDFSSPSAVGLYFFIKSFIIIIKSVGLSTLSCLVLNSYFHCLFLLSVFLFYNQTLCIAFVSSSFTFHCRRFSNIWSPFTLPLF